MRVNDSQVIDIFEKEVAKYAGAKYGVAVSSQTNAVFLCLQLLKMQELLPETITIPKRTYMSIPMTLVNVGCKIKFVDDKWSGAYRLAPTHIWDSAVRFTKDMYVDNSFYCVSFQYRKALPIGRGGMVLTNSKDSYETLKKLRFNGKTDGLSNEEDEFIQGWNMYFTPEQAARGLTMMVNLPKHNKDIACWSDYPDLSNKKVFK